MTTHTKHGQTLSTSPLLMLTRVLLVLVVLVTAVSAARRPTTTDIRFRVRRYADESNHMTILPSAGHPARAFPLTVAFSVPQSFHSEGLWNESATQGDLPGLYAAVYVASADPMRRELVSHARLGLAPSALLSQPTLRLHSLGHAHSWAVNASNYSPAAEVGVAYSQAVSRGFFLLGPGSAAWTKARFALVSHSELRLVDKAPPSLATLVPLVCKWRDARGRCVLDQGSIVLRYHLADERTRDEALTQHAPRLILDMDTFSTVLPRTVAARLLRGVHDTVAYNRTLRVEWRGLHLASADDVLPGAAESASGRPIHVVSADETTNDIVLGSAAALALFSEMVYDSSTATWYVCPSDPSNEEPEAARVAIAILLILQAFAMARQLLNPRQITTREVLESLSGRPVTRAAFNARDAHVLHWAYSGILLVLALVQIILGQVYLPRGACTGSFHADAIAAFGLVNAVAAGFSAVIHVTVMSQMQFGWPRTWSYEYIAGATYINVGLAGIMGSLLPQAVKGFTAFLLLAVLIMLQLFLLIYACLGSLVVFIRRAMRWTSRLRGVSRLSRATDIFWLTLCLGYATFVGASIGTGADIVLLETIAVLNTELDPILARPMAYAILAILAIASTFIVFVEVQDIDTRLLEEEAKKDM